MPRSFMALLHEQLHNCFGFLDPERHLLAHTEDEKRGSCDLQELDAYVCGDDKLDWIAAKCHDHAGPVVKRGRADQRTAAQEREDAILRQYKSRRWSLGDKKQLLVKHHRERSEVPPRLQLANGIGYPAHQSRVSDLTRPPSNNHPLRPRGCCSSPKPIAY